MISKYYHRESTFENLILENGYIYLKVKLSTIDRRLTIFFVSKHILTLTKLLIKIIENIYIAILRIKQWR